MKKCLQNFWILEANMNVKKCSICGTRLVKYGQTKKGTQRWYCKNCNRVVTKAHNKEIYGFKLFLSWLLSKASEDELPVSARSFRRHNEKYWKYWAIPEYIDEVHKVIFCDGIYLARNVVVLIACTEKHVLSWYLARSENSRSWSALMSKIAPPDMVVSDGGTGFRKALGHVWPSTSLQRCLFHVASQTRRYTTSRPKLKAGVELLNLSRALTRIKSIEQANLWKDAYIEWLMKWAEFLNERSKNELGKTVFTHERLRRARNAINRVLNDGTMFTYLNPLLNEGKELPCTNNVIEGSVNRQLREILRNHRGMPLIHRAKACFWWSYLHSPYILPHTEILKHMPTDEDIEYWIYSLDDMLRNNSSVERWGDAIVWNEFHMPTPYPFNNY